jgi:hypothetical protein
MHIILAVPGVDQFHWPPALTAVRVIDLRTKCGMFIIRNPANRDFSSLPSGFRQV